MPRLRGAVPAFGKDGRGPIHFLANVNFLTIAQGL
jgi:hypothetical protein